MSLVNRGIINRFSIYNIILIYSKPFIQQSQTRLFWNKIPSVPVVASRRWSKLNQFPQTIGCWILSVSDWTLSVPLLHAKITQWLTLPVAPPPQYESKKRISAEEAMKHSYFRQLGMRVRTLAESERTLYANDQRLCFFFSSFAVDWSSSLWL